MLNYILENWIALLSLILGIALFIWLGTRRTSTINPKWDTDNTHLSR